MQKTADATLAKKVTSNLTKNVIQFRKGFINIPNSNCNNHELAMSVVSELMQFGYIPSTDAIQAISLASEEDIIPLHNELISFLKKMTGSTKSYRPFWKGFPQEVMDKSESELWMHQIINYWTNGAYEPSDWTKERPTAFEKTEYTTINLGDEDKFLAIFTDLTSVNSSLTPEDLDIIKWFASEGVELRFPKAIPFKENLCTLASMGLDVPVKTTTDVLRIAVAMSGGDISLPKVPRKTVRVGYWRSAVHNVNRDAFKFKKFTRKERKYILGLLEKTNCDSTEAVLKSQRWVRLGEILHPGEYTKKFPAACAMFDAIRNDKIQSWYGKVNKAFESSFGNGIEVLSERPGEFMRRLDWLIRKYGASQEGEIAGAFRSIANKVSNKVLFEAYKHFDGRDVVNDKRTIMVKGSRKRTALPTLPALSTEAIKSIQGTIEDCLKAKFSTLPKFGKVCIDEELKKIPVPFNMRSLNPALKPTVRGSRLPWDNKDAKVIRAFLRFEKDNTNMTIDLSTVLVGSKGNAVVDWRTHKSDKNAVIHSGDSFGRTGACAEYIDIDIEKSLALGYKYALIQLHNYNRSPELNENNYFGVMERNFPKSNEIWLPKTISNCSVVRVENIVNCAIIDIVSGEYIMVDEDAEKSWLNVASTLDFKQVEEYIKPPKFSVYDLLKLHVDARGGELVEADVKADTYFAFDDFSTNYIETLKLMGI